MATLVRRSKTARSMDRAVQKVNPDQIQLQNVFDQMEQILNKTKSADSCLIIGDLVNSVSLIRSKDTIEILCDIPGILMGISIKKEGEYNAVVKTGNSWYDYNKIYSATSTINLSDIKDEYNRANVKMLIDLIKETYDYVIKEEQSHVGSV